MMNTYLSLCSRKNGEPYLLCWQLVSFLALEVDEQIALIGPAKEWFMREQADVNPGGNYLFGLLVLLNETGGGRHFDEFAIQEAVELEQFIKLVCADPTKYQWGISALNNREPWEYLRKLANTLLEKSGIWINPPKTPLWLPEYMEIWWKNYKELNRAK